jgi:hypothetical protein
MSISLFADVIVSLLLVATIVYAALLNRRLSAFRANRAEMESLIRAFADACARAEAGTRSLRSATEEATRLQSYLDRSQNLRDDLSYLLDRGGSLADRLEGGVRTARSESTRAAPVERVVSERAQPERPVVATERPIVAERAPVAPTAVDSGAAPSAGERGSRERMRERMRAALRGQDTDGAADAPSAERAPADRAAGDRVVAERAPDRVSDRLAERMAQRVAERVAQRAGERDAPQPAASARALRDRMPARGEAADDGEAAPPRSRAERELLQALRGRR